MINTPNTESKYEKNNNKNTTCSLEKENISLNSCQQCVNSFG